MRVQKWKFLKNARSQNKSFNKVWWSIENKSAVRLSWRSIRVHSSEKNPKGEPSASYDFVTTLNTQLIESGTLFEHWNFSKKRYFRHKFYQELVISGLRLIRYGLCNFRKGLLYSSAQMWHVDGQKGLCQTWSRTSGRIILDSSNVSKNTDETIIIKDI